ncbi:uncharacterized protein LY89DRAFT_724990 [Mollisia scopiformis]|uniref:Mid2 domain-containing protein n=1 Tax=Mollisia scopiformis TaxID=149040 RepID=A0A132B8F6_MOLSC|nr:uncharacterized protein LY89DRAFT_724990 [Mollisia scopiformis]KUJ08533.1 hypothetical protein LY89DRAFT_724990 [Mollisia scopiformis]
MATVAFTNPPAPGAVGDFTSDPVYEYGTPVFVQWNGNASSLTLWQLQPGAVALFGSPEFLIDVTNTENSSDVTPYTDFNWLVQTSKNLTLSNRFILSLFDVGQATPLCNSHYFEIRPKSGSPVNATSSTVLSSSTQTPVSPSGTVALSLTPAASSSAASTQISNSGLSVGAKIGFGLGVPAAILLGLALGWFLQGLWRRRGEKSPISPVSESQGKVNEIPETVGDEEMPGSFGGKELDGSAGGQELPGSLPPHYELAE